MDFQFCFSLHTHTHTHTHTHMHARTHYYLSYLSNYWIGHTILFYYFKGQNQSPRQASSLIKYILPHLFFPQIFDQIGRSSAYYIFGNLNDKKQGKFIKQWVSCFVVESQVNSCHFTCELICGPVHLCPSDFVLAFCGSSKMYWAEYPKALLA